jgi:Phosphotransferase enzyme family
MAEDGPGSTPDLAWVADVVARQLGQSVRVQLVERRWLADVFTADTPTCSLLLKLGASADLRREAANLDRAGAIVGDLAPRLVGFVETADSQGLLTMTRLPGVPVQPRRLSYAAWRHLTQRLLRLHAQIADSTSTCVPFTPNFIIIGPAHARAVDWPGFRRHLSRVVEACGHIELATATVLLDALHARVATDGASFELRPRLIHADLWPDNVLVSGSRAWLVDWAWLTASDYALDLANLKLMLDWVWPAWLSHVEFERLVRRYAVTLGDLGLAHRLSVYLPLVSLIHLVQYAEGGLDDPHNAAAMKTCLAVAQRDFAVWRQSQPARRTWTALGQPSLTEYEPGSGGQQRWLFGIRRCPS